MTIDIIESICLNMPHVTTDIKWQNLLCFCIKKKIFVIVSLNDFPINISFKATEETFNILTEQEGFKPAPYLGRYKWIFVDNIERLTLKEWQHYLQEAYHLIAAKK